VRRLSKNPLLLVRSHPPSDSQLPEINDWLVNPSGRLLCPGVRIALFLNRFLSLKGKLPLPEAGTLRITGCTGGLFGLSSQLQLRLLKSMAIRFLNFASTSMVGKVSL